MKKLIVLISALMIGLSGAFAQNEKVADTTDLIAGDNILSIIRNALPAGWSMRIEQQKIIVERKDSVWVLLENRLNSLVTKMDKEKKEEEIKARGKRTASYVIYLFEEKWSIEKVEDARQNNSKLCNELRALPKKYGVENLRDAELSTKEHSVYAGKTDEEKKNVEGFEKEKFEIEAKIIKLPNYHTTHYSIYFVEESGADDSFHIIFPEDASKQLYHIKMLFLELCGK
ncbi:MAG: hypothetical protein KKA07_00110 [Bacteroidetes bacterium]|nr:hypothetical protein [Bacteroidota bacterium]MBU1717453.1 hypothetical protein [Bacteroidota bacterium]